MRSSTENEKLCTPHALVLANLFDIWEIFAEKAKGAVMSAGVMVLSSGQPVTKRKEKSSKRRDSGRKSLFKRFPWEGVDDLQGIA